jgi:hypothetical protein
MCSLLNFCSLSLHLPSFHLLVEVVYFTLSIRLFLQLLIFFQKLKYFNLYFGITKLFYVYYFF